MKSTAVKFCALLTIAVTSSGAFAAVNVTFANRSVVLNNAPTLVTSSSSNATSGAYVDSVSDSGGSDNTATSGSAEQTSDIQALTFGGSGTAHVTGHPGSPDNLAARTKYTITFSTDIAYDWIISGQLGVNLDGGNGYAYVSLADSNAFTSVHYVDQPGFGTENAAGSGTIAPGLYTFEISAQPDGTDGGNSWATAYFEDVFLTLTPSAVPEPASLSMLAIGGAALLMRRRK